MEEKTKLLGVATLFLAFGLLPGATGTIQTNNAITRTFSSLVLAEVEFKDPGLGIFSSTARCPFILFGQREGVPATAYYDTDRVATNLKMGSVELLTGQPPIIVLAGPCPIPGSGPGAPVILTIPDTNMYGPHDAVKIDQILCLQGNGPVPVTCLPDAATGLVTVSHCNKDDANFDPSPNDGKNFFAGLVGSRSIDCVDEAGDPTDGFKHSVTYYDGAPTGYVDDWFFAPGTWGTDFSLIQNEDTTPLGNGIDETGYLVTCISIEILVIDPNKNPSQYTMRVESHDYLLVLDLDGTPENWADALEKHHAFSLQGWHDLGGKNGFPCPEELLPPDKKGDFPIIPTPLSPKKEEEPNVCLVLRDVAGTVTDQCTGAVCAPSPPPVDERTCTVAGPNACEPKTVAVLALNSQARVLCSGALVASTVEDPPGPVGTKPPATLYECQVVLGAFPAFGLCFDP